MASAELDGNGSSEGAETAGVVVGLDDKLYFVPADVAGQIVHRPVVTRVPGTAIGMALIGGRVVTVIDVGPRRDELLVCDVEGETIALSGFSVQGSGFFSVEGELVRVDDKLVPAFDVKSALVKAELEVWAARQGTRTQGT